MIDAAFEISLLVDEGYAIIAQGEVVHAVHLCGFVGGIQFADDIQRLKGGGPILCIDELLCALIGAFNAAEIRRGGGGGNQSGGWDDAYHHHFGELLLGAGKAGVVCDDEFQALYRGFVVAKLDVGQCEGVLLG